MICYVVIEFIIFYYSKYYWLLGNPVTFCPFYRRDKHQETHHNTEEQHWYSNPSAGSLRRSSLQSTPFEPRISECVNTDP